MRKTMFVLAIMFLATASVCQAETIEYRNVANIHLSGDETVVFLQAQKSGVYIPHQIKLYGLFGSRQIVIKTDLAADKEPYIWAEYEVDDTIWRGHEKNELRLYYSVIIHVRSLSDIK